MDRPVALKPLVLLPNLELPGEVVSWLLLELLPYLPLPDDELLPDDPEVCACALSNRHAVQNAIPATICFLILPSFRFLLIVAKLKPVSAVSKRNPTLCAGGSFSNRAKTVIALEWRREQGGGAWGREERGPASARKAPARQGVESRAFERGALTCAMRGCCSLMPWGQIVSFRMERNCFIAGDKTLFFL